MGDLFAMLAVPFYAFLDFALDRPAGAALLFAAAVAVTFLARA
jgi:hypothetical protein